ncbi:hypothetical protein [Paenibacillus sp. 32O-W]|uniref:hypothetical protein n=1 Tax=Paenibacillus sp. 32O-W TaxID=1695218 RepID=UPI000784A1AF|nr:hypothetical protein [Paenibacillus sp. 32O-W]
MSPSDFPMFGEAEASSFEYSAQGENVQQFLFVLAEAIDWSSAKLPFASSGGLTRVTSTSVVGVHLRHHRLIEEEDEMLPVCQKRL